MRIEMLGPPTSGKSTLHRSLGIARGAWNKDSGEIPDEWKPFAERIRAIYGDPTMFEKRLLTLPLKTFMALGAAYKGDQSEEPMVFDELVAQCGLSMAIRCAADWTWYFREMPLPGLLVVLNAPREVLEERNRSRGSGGHTKKTIRAYKRMPKIVGILKDRGCPMLEFDTSIFKTEKIAKAVLKRVTK